MGWRSLFGRRPSRRWIPVSNTDDADGSDTDELMRLADGDYDVTGNDATTQAVYNSSHEAPVFQRLQPSNHQPSRLAFSSLLSSSTEDSNISEPENVSKIACFCGPFKLAFPPKKWYYILLSFFVIFSFVGLTVGLGVYSLIFYYPDKLVIDKSVKSFSIPNHEAYRNFEAMMLARKNNASRYRRDTQKSFDAGLRWKRDASDVTEKGMLNQAHRVLKNLRHDGVRFFRNKKNSRLQKSFSAGFSLGSTLNKVLDRFKRSAGEIDCLLNYQSVARWKMHVIYLAHGDNDTNMFTRERLQTAHDIEKKIIEHPGFHNFCLRDPNMEGYDPSVHKMNGCVPLNSLLTYFYPSKDEEGTIFYDGMGANIVDIDSALKLAMTQESFYYYVDDKINKTFQKSHLLRSEVLFGAPLPGYACINDVRKDQDEKFKDFVVTYIHLLSKSSTDKVRVLYGGNEIFDYEVTTSFWSDVRLAIISLVAIFVLMLVLSLSPYLTVVGVVVIAVSFPISLFFYRVAFGINALGILNGAAAFVIIGIGVDDVFVYMNIYRQADHMKDPVKRIWYTVKTAGVATFFTSFTTAAAFAANIASSIPAVYEFGLFMSLIVSSCWISVFVMMPPALYLHACWFEPMENFILSCFSCVGFRGEGSSNSSPLHQYNQQQGSDYHLYDEDLPMLDVDGLDRGSSFNNFNDEGINDDDMLLMDDPNSVNEAQSYTSRELSRAFGQSYCANAAVETNHMEPLVVDDSNMCLGLLLQRVMVYLTDRVVIRGRYFVIGFYAALLIGSCVLMAQLKPSTHPPQLFRPDTNIQQLLDLKANFTIIDTLHCDRCSAIYKVRPSRDDRSDSTQHFAPVTPRPTDSEETNQQSTETSSAPSSTQPGHTFTPDLASTAGPTWQGGSKLDQSIMNVGGQTEYVPFKALALGVYKVFSQWLSSSHDGSSQVFQSTSHFVPAVTSGIATVGTRVPTVISSTAPAQVPSTQQPQHHEEERIPLTTQVSHYIPDGAKRSNQQSPPPGKSSSVEENFNACKGQMCNNLKDRPLIESGATVYIVFGIKGVDRSQEDVGHVLDQFKGKTIFDLKFAQTFNLTLDFHDLHHLQELCAVCNIIANQTDLVKEGSAQCVPSGMYPMLYTKLNQIQECRNIPGTVSGNHQSTIRAEGGMDWRQKRLLWLAFAFESTTSEGQAYFEAYKQFQKWEKLISDIKKDVLSPDSPLQSMFQTSEFWPKVMMEVVAVNSALYGLVLSMIICVMAVAVFTGHIVLLLIVVVTIIAMICCVVGVFALAGWEMGAVEAVSLSILVGSSVDYCVHIVEGYILAGKRMPLQYMKSQAAADIRKQRTSQAVRHIGVAIICSALTTIIAAVPLTQTYIQPFAKFGSILLINTTVSMVMTLTLAVALMAMFGPAHYKGGWKAHLIAFGVVTGIIGASILGLYIATTKGVSIPGPSGNQLFS